MHPACWKKRVQAIVTELQKLPVLLNVCVGWVLLQLWMVEGALHSPHEAVNSRTLYSFFEESTRPNQTSLSSKSWVLAYQANRPSPNFLLSSWWAICHNQPPCLRDKPPAGLHTALPEGPTRFLGYPCGRVVWPGMKMKCLLCVFISRSIHTFKKYLSDSGNLLEVLDHWKPKISKLKFSYDDSSFSPHILISCI